MSSTLPGWCFDNNYSHAENGRIWIVWDPAVSVIIFSKSSQLILCSVQISDSSPSFAVAFVYAHNTEIQRRTLWTEINRLSSTSPLSLTPWIISDALAVFDPSGDSYHTPCLIDLDSSMPSSKKAFKYFTFLTSHPNYLAKFQEAWNDPDLWKVLIIFIKKAKDSLAKLESIQEALLRNPMQSLCIEESEARKVWNFFADAQESFFRQKSRLRWLKDGDANTTFFHKVVVANQARNAIRILWDSQGTTIDDISQIKEMIIAYYTFLLDS
ncbi:uncharacterized protein LOC112082143 [Eutrema salsugineum]|uniref:uncharacterized protein LOC112082143 n=1 Tax=Eutrema salsugineum TaxID=72664 RepID=UPI000CED40A5|nr:uncharacterized protein LOC112082143 [Eutrema salsugineum]